MSELASHTSQLTSETPVASSPMTLAQRSGIIGALLVLVLFHFLFQSAAFQTELRPDEYKAIADFGQWFQASQFSPTTEFHIRLMLLIFNFTTLALLFQLRLVTRNVLIFTLIWPLTIFLFSKIYWEFFIFPLCLIRYDLPPLKELTFIVALAALGLLTGENNVFVLLLFRLVLLGQHLGFPHLAPLGFLGTSMGINMVMKLGLSQHIPLVGDYLARFNWTREMVNPEYSILETIAVFASSLHFFTLHTAFWWLDFLFSLTVLGVIFSFQKARQQLWENRNSVLAVAAVVIGLTEITHAFQNARYYFFFLPLLGLIAPVRSYFLIALLGVLHVILKSTETIAL